MPSTTGFEFGEVVLVDFPFTDRAGARKRPAVVVSSLLYNQRRRDVILMPVTSRLRTPPGFGETPVTLWREAGLLVPGAVKPILLTLDSTLVLRRLGRLEPVDRTALEVALRGIVSAS